MEKSFLFKIWIIKLGYGVLFTLIFTYYFGDGKLYGDAANFFNDSQILSNVAQTDFAQYLSLLFGFSGDEPQLLMSHLAETQIWSAGDNGDAINDNRLIIRINSIIHFFSFANVYVHVFIFTFISFIGSIFIFKAFKDYVKNQKLFFTILVLLPSIAFWSSGITKESIMLLGFGLFIFHLFKTLKREASLSTYPFLALGIFILLINKPYFGLIVISLSSILVLGITTKWNKILLFLFPVLVVLFGILLSFTPEQFNIVSKTSYKQRDLINMGKGGVFFITDSSFCDFDYKHIDNFEKIGNDKITVLNETEGHYKLFGQSTFHPFTIQPSKKEYALYLTMEPSKSYVDVTPINYSGTQLVKNIPEALINTTLRPFPTDPGSPLKYFVFIQNIIVIGFIIFCLIRRRGTSVKEKYIISYLLFTAVLVLLIIGWTTPILGAVVRYKIGAELALIIAMFILLKPIKFKFK